MMNSGRAKFKRTHIDRFMNKLIIGVSYLWIFFTVNKLIISFSAYLEWNFLKFRRFSFTSWKLWWQNCSTDPVLNCILLCCRYFYF
jgi:hypothetical protein